MNIIKKVLQMYVGTLKEDTAAIATSTGDVAGDNVGLTKKPDKKYLKVKKLETTDKEKD